MQNKLYNFLVGCTDCAATGDSTVNPDDYRRIVKTVIQLYDDDIHAPIPLIRFVSMAASTTLDLQLESRKQLPASDLRIRDFTLRNFRKFPYLDPNIMWGIDGKKSGGTDDACSLFLVGNNGTGKTSLFSALEYLFSGAISTVDERKIAHNADYMVHGFDMLKDNNSSNVYVAMNCMDHGLYTNQDCMQFPAVNFCSDHDIYRFSESGEVMDHYILDYLGYKEIEDLISILGDLSEKYKQVQNSEIQLILSKSEMESCFLILQELYMQKNVSCLSCLDRLITDLSQYYQDIEKIKIEKGQFTENEYELIDRLIQFYEQVESLLCSYKAENGERSVFGSVFASYLKIINDFQIKPTDHFEDPYFQLAYYKNIVEHLPGATRALNRGISILRLIRTYIDEHVGVTIEALMRFIHARDNFWYVTSAEDVSNIYDNYNRFMPYIELLKKELQDKRKELIALFYETSQQMVCRIMAMFSDANEKFSLENIENSINFKITVTEENGTFEATPKAYFNTFRYKLFIISLKTALTFTFMKEHRCLLPLVIDDIFNSSDFQNGLSIENFVKSVYTTFHDMFQDQYPGSQLQIILFTHDELLLHSFKKGYHRFYQSHRNSGLLYQMICGRLFPYEDILNEKRRAVRRIYHQYGSYRNLYLEVLSC